jgi:hypothetical protein
MLELVFSWIVKAWGNEGFSSSNPTYAVVKINYKNEALEFRK